MRMYRTKILTSVAALSAGAGAAAADTISPTSFSADLDVGESTTVRKEVTVESGGTSSALLDSFFLFDTTGSMSAEINASKDAAGDLLDGLDDFGDSAAGVGVFGERALLSDAIRTDLTTDKSTVETAINDVTLGDPDLGGSFPESSNTAIDLAATNVSWRAGSNRFMFVLGDASSNEFVPDADVISSLSDENVNLVGLNFGGSPFADDITDLGGEVFDSSATPEAIIGDVTAGIAESFAEYSEVTVDDLDGGLPAIDVTTECVSADSGACNGAVAEGDFDRSEDRSFMFDVTFMRVGEGDAVFPSFALVDGGSVATENDSFTSSDTPPAPIPLPAAGWLLAGAVGGLAAFRRERA